MALPLYVATREALKLRANAVFEANQGKILRCEVPRTYTLENAAEAHRALGGRQTFGPTVLIP